MGPEPLPRQRWPRGVRVIAQALAALLALYGAAQLVVHRPSFKAFLRDRATSALESRLGPVELGPEVGVDWAFRIRLGPLEVPGSHPGDPSLLRVEAIRVRPDLMALLRTRRPAPASVWLHRVRLELPDRPGAARELAKRFRPASSAPGGKAAPELPDPVIRAEEVQATFTAGERRITTGPIQATVHRWRSGAGGSSITAALRFPGTGQGTLELQRDPAGWRAAVRLDRLGPEVLPAGLGGPAARWAGGTLSLQASGDAAPDLSRASARVEVSTAGLQVGGAVVGAEPIGPFDLRFAGALAWDAKARRVMLERGQVELPGGAAIGLAGEVGLRRGLPFNLALQADGVDFLRAVSALPPPLALPPEAPHPEGTLDARLSLEGPLLDPGGWAVDASLDLSRMREAAKRAPKVTLLAPFVHQAETEEGPPQPILVGLANPDFVPLSELPAYLVRAVTASEDAGFFGHTGFDFAELRNAAVQGAQAGRVVRGGSTISQQLAKNLYLSREKTLARKLREAMVTLALEATVPKHRLMEIYLNVAEWGPGLWGIGPAARHWFGKDARALTPREAAFLATVIPGPRRYHAMWYRGSPSEAWTEHVDGLLRTMYGQGSLSWDELETALEQPILFARPAAHAADGGEPGADAAAAQ